MHKHHSIKEKDANIEVNEHSLFIYLQSGFSLGGFIGSKDLL